MTARTHNEQRSERYHEFARTRTSLEAWFGLAAGYDLCAMALTPLLPACAWMLP